MERSALGVVLHISRVVGVAPFLQGEEYGVSVSLIICAKLFISITAIFYIIAVATSPVFYLNKGSVLAYDIIRILSKFSAILTAFVCVFTSPERMMRFFRFLKELNKINTRILSGGHPKVKEIKLTVMILIYLHVALSIRCYDFYYNVHSFNAGKMGTLLLNFLIVIVYYMTSLSEVQLVLFTRKYLFSLKVINNALENLYKSQSTNDITQSDRNRQFTLISWKKVGEKRITNTSSKRANFGTIHPGLNNKLLAPSVKTKQGKIEEPTYLIRQCIMNYLSVCNIIRATSKGDGLLIVILIMYHMLNLLSNSYKEILYLITMDSLQINIFFAIYGSLLHLIILIFFMEPHHKTQSEMRRLQFLLTSLKVQNFDKTDVSNELNLFWRIININRATCSPLGMFTPNRLFIVKVFGSVVTYLVILVTYGPEIKKTSSLTG